MNSKIIAIGCGVVLLVVLVAGGLWLRPASVKIDRTQTLNVSTGVGRVLAEETVKLTQGRGAIVVVSDHALEPDRNGRDGRWNAFRDELKKTPALRIVATEIVTPAPEMGMPGCPAAAFLQILNQHADAAAIVFLTDLPEWITVGATAPQRSTPKILAVDNMGDLTQRHYGGYFGSGLLAELIGARLAPAPASGANPQTPQEWFDRYYLVYTPQNFATLLE